MNKLLVICGPTATGKTKLAVDLAKKLNGEIVSADSRQVYCGMDIITGKEVNPEIKTWLSDVVNPDRKFSVANYYDLAWKAIPDIWSRGKLPIVVGGTGFYIKAVLEGIGTMGIGPDWELREQLTNCSIVELLNCLEKLDPERVQRMNESDRQNPRRLIRAIEIAKSRESLTVNSKSSKDFDKMIIGLTAPNEVLYQRIDQRVETRVKAGAEEEIRKLLNEGYNWENSVMGTTIGYKEWRPYFEKKETKEAVGQKWKFAEHDYARRQMTWFKKTAKEFFNIAADDWREKVEKGVKDWYI